MGSVRAGRRTTRWKRSEPTSGGADGNLRRRPEKLLRHHPARQADGLREDASERRGGVGAIRGWLRAPVIESDEKTGKPKPPRKSDGQGTPQGGVISPLLANVYLHWFDVKFHRQRAGNWANARLVRYADDFVVMARYHGHRIAEWIGGELEDCLD